MVATPIGELLPPNGETDLVPIILFPNQGAGFGFGTTRLGKESLPEGYDSTINMTVRDGRKLLPSFAFSLGFLYGSWLREVPGFAVAWSESDGTPLALAGTGTVIAKLINAGVLTSEADATGETYGSATFYDDGAGTALLYAGTTTGSKLLNRRNQAGTWTEDADVVALHVAGGGSRLWRVTSNYQVSNCPPGNDPFDITQWQAAVQVGTNEAAINSIGTIAGSPIVGKEDGIWVYEEDDNRFNNQYPVNLHPDNFPFMKSDGAGGLYTATADGSLVRIQRFGAITTHSLIRDKTPGRDTPRGPIKDIVVYGDRIFALMAPAYRLVQGDGVFVLKTTDNFGSFTNYSTQARDQDFSTVVDISLLDTLANGDALLIGFTEPFLAMRFVMSALNTTQTRLGVAFNDSVLPGVTGWQTLTAGADGDFFDGTVNVDAADGGGENERAFSKTGIIALRPSADISNWVLGSIDGLPRFWLRITVDVALSADVTISEISVVPKRVGPAFSTTNYDSAEDWNASGMLPKILMGRLIGTDILWDDVYTLHSPGDVGKILVTQLPTPNSPLASLVVFNRDSAFQIPLPFTLDPSLSDYTDLARDATGQLAPMLIPSAVDFGHLHELAYLDCLGENFVDGTDEWRVSFRWDETWPWADEQIAEQGLARFKVGHNSGRVLHTAFMINSGATNPAQIPVPPSGRALVAWVRPIERDAVGPQPTRASPEAT